MEEEDPFEVTDNCDLPEPPPEAIELACRLADSASERGMVYEEFYLEVEGGDRDGEEYYIVVQKL
jgi:hypothetical protein